MAQTSSDGLLGSSEEYISLQDILHAFNNSINEEQAWAVCYQCAQYFLSNSTQDKFREIYYYGTVAVRFRKDGEVLIDATTLNQGSGKGPPRKRSSFSLSREFKNTVQQIDAIQALGSAIYKALDYGLSATEEPHLAPDLEEVIDFMTNPEEDDEGIDQCIFQDIIDMCVKHVSDQDNAGQHYKAVCRALVTEAKQLSTFLDNIARGQERLSKHSDVEADGLDELQRSDWARLWVQIMRELRQGVRLRKVEHVQLTPMEYELTPFEILLEDIRLGRYKLNRIMVNGDIPPKVKNDAHAVILDFIRSRPPLKPVKRRELNSPPKREMDARELLLQDICKPHKLRHVKQGKVVVGARSTPLKLDDISSDEDSPKPVRKVIKPVAAFEVSDEESGDSSVLSDGTDDEGHHRISAPVMSPLSPVYPTADPESWKRAVAKDLVTQNSNCRALSRRHTITVYDTDSRGRKVQQAPSIESVICENEESPRENFVRGHASRRPTRLVLYRQHGSKMHGNGGVSSNLHCVHGTDVSRTDSPKMHVNMPSRRHSDVFISNHGHVHEPFYDSHNPVCVSNSVVNPPRSVSPCRHAQRAVSPCQHAGRAESPVRFLSRSETFTTSIPQNSRNCVRNKPLVTARCDSPQTRQLTHSESFSTPRCDSPSNHHRSDSPCRHSVPLAQSVRNNIACDRQSVHDCCSSPCHKVVKPERPLSPCARTSGNRSRSQSPCRRVSQTDNVHVSNNSHSSNKAVPVLRHSRSILRKPNKSVSDINHAVPANDQKDNDASNPTRHFSNTNYHSQMQVKDYQKSCKKEVGSNKEVPLFRKTDHLSLQDSNTEQLQKEQEVASTLEKKSHKPRVGIIRARSKPELIPSDLNLVSDNLDSKYKQPVRDRPVSEIDFRQPDTSRIPRALSVRSKSEKHLVSAFDRDSNQKELLERVPLAKHDTVVVESRTKSKDTEAVKPKRNLSEYSTKSKTEVKVDPKEEQHWGIVESKPKREVKLSRQSAIRTERKDLRLPLNEKSEILVKDGSHVQSEIYTRSRKLGVVSDSDSQEKPSAMREVNDKVDQTKAKPVTAVRTRHRVAFNEDEPKQSADETDNASAGSRPVKISRSKSEIRVKGEIQDVPRTLPETDLRLKGQLRSRSENRPLVSRSENRPVKGLHYLDMTDMTETTNNNVDLGKGRLSPVPSSSDEKLLNGDDVSSEESGTTFDGLSRAIKEISQLNVTDLLHVSWKSECPRKETNNSSPCSDCRPVSKKWQNPIECLSLTLEEVTHIRMVLTKAELESLITDPELYKLVSKGKVCFTCRNTKFSIFGQWSTKCKLCQRNVCNYCLRKMNVPTEHFEKIPVYTLSPVPISPEVLEAIKIYESTGSVPHSPTSERKKKEESVERSPENREDVQVTEDKLAAKRRTLQRSHTIGVGSRPLPNKALLKGPQMSICCDCKTMIMEIIRASRTSTSLVSKGKNDPTPSTDTSSQPTTQRSSLGVPMRQRVQDDKPRPRSMLESLNFKSFNISRTTTDA